MTDQQLTPDELYEQFFPAAGHVVAFDAEHEAEYAQIFSGEAHGAESEPASPEPTPEPPAATDAEERASKLLNRAVSAEVKAAASGFADPEDAAAFLDLSKYATPDGDVDTEALKSDLADLLVRKPHLGKTPGSRLPAPNPAQGSSGAGPGWASDEYHLYFPNER